MPQKDILTLLSGGDRRTIGRSDQVAAMVSSDLKLFPKLIAGLWSTDPLERVRSADATEKVTRTNPGLLRPYKKELLGLMSETTQQELRRISITSALLVGSSCARSARPWRAKVFTMELRSSR